MTIEQILAKLQEIAAKGETRSLTDEEVTEYEGLESQLKAAQKTAELRSRTAAYVAPNGALAAVVHVGTTKEDDTEERAFAHYLRTGKANSDLETRAQNEGTPSAGGYLVPETLLARIEQRAKVFGGVEAEAEVMVTDNGSTIKLNRNDDTAAKAVVVSELAAPASGGADLVFDQVVLDAHTLTTSGAGQAPISVSFQILQDSQIDLAAYIADRIGERFGRGIASYLVTGTGTGEPTGIVTNTVTESTFTGSTILKDELIAAQHDVDPAYRGDAVWIFNDSTLEAIRKLEDDNGRPLWTAQAQSGLETSIGGMLLGSRVVVDQNLASYADGGSNRWGVFGSVRSGFLVRRVAGMRLIVNEATGAQTGKVEYTAHIRLDSAVKQPYAYSVLKNS